MAIETEKILGYLGVDPKEIDSEDKFKETFDSTFIKRTEVTKDPELYKDLVGKFNGSMTTKIKQVAKSAGIEFEQGELKSNMPEEVMNIAFNKVQSKLKELEEKAGAGNDEKVKILSEEKSKWETKANEYKNLASQIEKDFTEKLRLRDESDKIRDIETAEKEALKKFKFKTGATELEIEGFISKFKKSFKLDKDTDGTVVPFNIKGERIKSKNKASEFMSLDEALTDFGIEKGIYAIAGDVGNPPPRKGLFGGGNPPPAQPPLAGRQVHPRAQRAAE